LDEVSIVLMVMASSSSRELGLLFKCWQIFLHFSCLLIFSRNVRGLLSSSPDDILSKVFSTSISSLVVDCCFPGSGKNC